MTKAVLLDTHIVLWAAAAPERLNGDQRKLLEDPGVDLLFSAVSVVEIEIKRTIGKLQLSASCDDLRRSIDAEWLPLEPAHAMAMRSLPLHHRDPFDRMLVAQAIVDSVDLVTSDAAMEPYLDQGLRIVR